MYKKLLWIAVCAFSILLNQAAFADSAICGESLKSMVKSLKLDDSQKGKITPILDQLKSNMKGNWTQMKGLEDQITQQVTSASMDQNTVNGLVDQKTKLIGDMIKAKITAKNQIFNLLNDQQKSQLQMMIKKLEEKMAAKYKACHKDE